MRWHWHPGKKGNAPARCLFICHRFSFGKINYSLSNDGIALLISNFSLSVCLFYHKASKRTTTKNNQNWWLQNTVGQERFFSPSLFKWRCDWFGHAVWWQYQITHNSIKEWKKNCCVKNWDRTTIRKKLRAQKIEEVFLLCSPDSHEPENFPLIERDSKSSMYNVKFFFVFFFFFVTHHNANIFLLNQNNTIVCVPEN